MKRLTALLIATLLAMTALWVPALADESTWLTPEKVTFTAFATIPANNLYTDDLDNNWFTQYAEEYSNIHIDWVDLTYGASADDNVTKLNLMLASGNYPDIITTNAFTKLSLYQAGLDGILLPLNDLIETSAPTIKGIFEERPDIAAQWTAPDGNIYGLGYITEYYHGEAPNRYWIYTPWLEKLGLEMPQTTEDFYNVLVAFRDGDPNGNGEADEIPMLNINKIWMICPFQYYDGSNVELDGETVKFSANTDGYHDAVRYIHKLYEEKLLPMDVFTLDTTQQSALVMSDPYKVGCIAAFSSGGIWTDSPKTNENSSFRSMYPVTPLEGPTGLRQIPKGTFNFGPNRFSITSSCSNPELAMAWCDLFYQHDFSFTCCYGPKYDEPVTDQPGWYEVDGLEYSVQLGTDHANYNNNISWGMQIMPFYGPITEANKKARMDGTFGYSEAMYALSSDLYDPYKVTQFRVPDFFMSEEGSQDIAEYKAVINPLVDQWFAEFVTGVKDVEADWDAYLAELDGMGLADYLEAYQKEYDTGVLGK